MKEISIQVFYILLSLGVKQRHGYEIMKQVEEASGGKVKLGPGTLYGAIKRMLSEKLIEEVKSDEARRRYYKLTEKGVNVLNEELVRYREALDTAKRFDLFDLVLKKDKLSYD